MTFRIHHYLGSRGRSVAILLLLVSCLIHVRALEARTLRIGALDETRHGSFNVTSGLLSDDLRHSLSRHIEALGFDDYEFVSMSRLTPDLPALVDVIILHPALTDELPMRGELSTDEQEALRDFVKKGGGVVIAADGHHINPAHVSASNAILAPFGVRLDGSAFTTTPFGNVTVAHPVTDGPFGQVTSPRLGERADRVSWFAELGPFASALVTAEPNDEPLLAVIERNALASGSGRVVMTSEANWGVDSFDGGFFQQHEVLFLNIMAWLTEDAPPPAFRRTALDDYVAAPDANYSFSLVRTLTGGLGYTEYHLDMTSQKWREETEVNRTLWQHRVIIVVPDTVSSSVALLGIVDGDNGEDLAALSFEREWALNTNTVVASLRQVPNQPLVFTADGRSRVEDEILAFTFAKFLDTGDETWPALLPMVKSAVRAMDTVQTFLAEETGGAISIERFVAAGPSKRAWTAWLTAAVDPRVEAIIPVVFAPGFDEGVQHHRRVYEGVTEGIVGGYAETLHDYVDENVLERISTPQGQALLEIIDPYAYRDRLTMPKFLINATGDQFVVPDLDQFFFHDLVGPKYLRHVPNAGHSIPLDAWTGGFQSFYESVVHGDPLPQFTWTVEPDGSIRVEAETTPLVVRQWQATNPTHRDFRIDTFGPGWSSSLLEDQGGGVYIGRVESPSPGYTAFFVEMEFPGRGSVPHTFTTEVVVSKSEGAESRFLRGDCNDDGAVDIADPVATLFARFLGAFDITCDDACDSNDDGIVDMSDAITTLEVLFLGQSVIPLPGMRDCGVDPTRDESGCRIPPESCR